MNVFLISNLYDPVTFISSLKLPQNDYEESKIYLPYFKGIPNNNLKYFLILKIPFLRLYLL